MNNGQQELELFGQHIVQTVRDEMIIATDQALLGQRRDIYSRYLHDLGVGLPTECRSFVEALIPYLVDGTIGVMLQQFDVHADWLQIRVRNNKGVFVNLWEITDGLEGEYSAHWSRVYTQQREDSISQATERLFERENISQDNE